MFDTKLSTEHISFFLIISRGGVSGEKCPSTVVSKFWEIIQLNAGGGGVENKVNRGSQNVPSACYHFRINSEELAMLVCSVAAQ